ncbi:elongation factor G [Pseudactinotalea terrae]|uniref:elongation factor G n=1 Tax=Pseudactinotalea terrae TaxID=1743262 RepID=UPI0012E29C1B|nr:TetM/TetW/TetO/TetS family tetracycline resistance ribosomal protection protein [Pseudactinotalea terrae]
MSTLLPLTPRIFVPADLVPTAVLHLGVLAHVDAGKTTLTEQLLHHAGVVDRPGRVDHGDTVTDADDIERRRGITIRAAVVSFELHRADGGSVAVNLLDTPGHADFVAEVERSLGVLDAAILVISAVEGVQPQTRMLIRALERLGLPFLVVVNKIDRAGARGLELLAELDAAMTGRTIALTAPAALGSRDAHPAPRTGDQLLADIADAVEDHEPGIVRAFLEEREVDLTAVTAAVGRQTAAGRLHPVLHTAALTGVGIAELVDAVVTYLPAVSPAAGGLLRARAFRVGRDGSGHRLVHVRVDSGCVQARDRLTVHHHDRWGGRGVLEEQVTGSAVLEGSRLRDGPVHAGQIGVLRGLVRAAVGDGLGVLEPGEAAWHFPPPGLEAVIRPADPARRADLHRALLELADADPLIDVRIDEGESEIAVSLYGEVQREVLGTRLAEEFGIDTEFLPTRVVHVERPAAAGEARRDSASGNAQVGLLLEPAAPGSGARYVMGVERGNLLPAFHTAVEATVHQQLRRGLQGWRVVDCVVTLVHGRFHAATPSAGEFRRLAAEALRAALRQAGTMLCAPWSRIEVRMPEAALPGALALLVDMGGTPAEITAANGGATLLADLATERIDLYERRVPDLTSGLGTFLAEPAGYAPVG